MPALAVAAVGAVGAFAAANAEKGAAKSAANAQRDATAQSVALQREIYEQNRADTQPYRAAGTNALARLLRGHGFEVDVNQPGGPIGSVGTGGATIPEDSANFREWERAQGDEGSPGTLSPIAQMAVEQARTKLKAQGIVANTPAEVLAAATSNSGIYISPGIAEEIRQGGTLAEPGRARGDDRTAEKRAYGLDIRDTGAQGEFSTPLIYDPGEFAGEFEFDPADIVNDPSYQFRKSEGLDALDRYRRASGLSLSGGAVREAEEFGSGLASQEYGAAYGRKFSDFLRRQGLGQDVYNSRVQDRASRQNALFNIAGLGQTGTGQQIGAASNFANSAGSSILAGGSRAADYITQGGNAQAAGYAGAANAVTGGYNNYLLFNLLNKGGGGGGAGAYTGYAGQF